MCHSRTEHSIQRQIPRIALEDAIPALAVGQRRFSTHCTVTGIEAQVVVLPAQAEMVTVTFPVGATA